MNLAGLPQNFNTPAGAVDPAVHPIVAHIQDRNPVLSQCVSLSLSAFPMLECHAAAFDSVALCGTSDPGDGSVFVFDPAQITRPMEEFLGDVKQDGPHKTVAYSFDTSNEVVNSALDAGVDCYASKEQDLFVLYLAIATAAQGGRFLCPKVANGFTRHCKADPVRETVREDPKDLLSSRELAVIKALASGLSQKQTAFELDLSEKTISTYKSRAMRKLGLTDRASLVRFAMEAQLL